MKKYELTSETKVINGVELHKIKALKSFGNINKGELGGWIEDEKNLSQDGDSWVYDNATVYENARVFDNATVCDNATVFDNATVYGNAWVGGHGTVEDNATVDDNATVGGYAKVGGDAKVGGYSWVCENAIVDRNAIVYGNAVVSDNATVGGKARVGGDATVRGEKDYIVFKNWWSSGRYFTWTRSNNKWSVGCFYGSGEELIAKAYKDNEKSGREYERVVKYVNDILKEEEDNDNGNRNKCED